MKRLFFALVISAIIALPLWADTDEHDALVDNVLSGIRNELGLKENDNIDPDMVPQNLLEELGDAVMGLTRPDARQHEWMDDMMGRGGRRGGMGMMGDQDDFFGYPGTESPEDIVKRRYANGEISRSEYRQMLDDLKDTE